MQQIKTIAVDGVVENGQIKLKERLPETVPAQVKVIVVYPELMEDDRPLNELSREEFAQQFHAAMAAAGYDTNEKISELVREVKREQAKELGFL